MKKRETTHKVSSVSFSVSHKSGYGEKDGYYKFKHGTVTFYCIDNCAHFSFVYKGYEHCLWIERKAGSFFTDRSLSVFSGCFGRKVVKKFIGHDPAYLYCDVEIAGNHFLASVFNEFDPITEKFTSQPSHVFMDDKWVTIKDVLSKYKRYSCSNYRLSK